MKIRIRKVGTRIGKLTLIKDNVLKRNSRYFSKYKCDCGKTAIISKTSYAKSCGCLLHQPAHNRIHNLGEHRLYKVWLQIKQRCYNEDSPAYHNYGGRGIKMCVTWKNNFLPFYNWAIKHGYARKLVIDRKNVNGNYAGRNCRWVTYKESGRNRRDTLGNKKVKIVKQMLSAGIPHRKIAKNFGVTKSCITNINTGRSYRD